MILLKKKCCNYVNSSKILKECHTHKEKRWNFINKIKMKSHRYDEAGIL